MEDESKDRKFVFPFIMPVNDGKHNSAIGYTHGDWKSEHKELKDLLLDFLLESQNHFRDKEPFEISLKEAINYVEDFMKKASE